MAVEQRLNGDQLFTGSMYSGGEGRGGVHCSPRPRLTAIDVNTGKTLWRINEAPVRESIGLSED